MSTVDPYSAAELRDSSRLIVTNGDSAAEMFREFGFRSPILPWRDVLHDGPVPDLPIEQLSEVRAGFLYDQDLAPLEETLRQFSERDRILLSGSRFQEIVLWFEHDLYDQLQLLQVIHTLAAMEPGPKLTGIFSNAHITSFGRTETLAHFQARLPLTEQQLDRGASLWTAFTRGEYRRLEEVALNKDTTFPHLAAAMRRWLEEFPWVTHGLTRSEYQILERINWHLRLGPIDLFTETQRLEEATFLGDSSFWSYLEDLVNGGILEVEDANEFHPPWKLSSTEEFRSQSLVLSVMALFLLEDRDYRLGPGDRSMRWRGGAEINSENPWWWDPEKERLVQSHAKPGR